MPKKSIPLQEDTNVKELLEVLSSQSMGTLFHEFSDLLKQMSTLEKQLNHANEELKSVKHQLSQMQNKKHPIAVAVTDMTDTLEAKITEMRFHLDTLKQTIIESAKKAVVCFFINNIHYKDV